MLNYFSVKMIEYLKEIRPTIFFPSKRKEKGKIIRNIYLNTHGMTMGIKLIANDEKGEFLKTIKKKNGRTDEN